MNALDNLAGPKQEDILKRITAVRGDAEPSEPTEEPQAQEVSPEEEVAEQAEEVTEATEAQPETVETDEPEQSESNLEDSYIDFNGEEISFTQIEEWRQGDLRQSDYTRKSQVNADLKRKLEARDEELTVKGQKLDDLSASLEVLIGEFDQTEFDGQTLDELRQNDPGEYLRVTEMQMKRKEALNKAKGERSSISDGDRQAANLQEMNLLMGKNPHWIKDGKATKAYDNDIAIVNKYLDGIGYTEEMKVGVLTSGNGQVFIDAAKYHASQANNAAITKKVRKAPVVTKPGGVSKSTVTTELEKARANHKRLGTEETALALRRAQRKFKGE